MSTNTKSIRRVPILKRKTYRHRVKKSTCRKKTAKQCLKTKSLKKRCKIAKGKKHTYCRKKRNKKVRFNQ